jgi:ABC-type protease/lipase transport system fused ATPase/permease subunit
LQAAQIEEENLVSENMASKKQRAAARKNVRKAARAAQKKRTVANLPKSARTALGKQGAKVAAQKRRQRAA